MQLLYPSNNFLKAPLKNFCVIISMTSVTATFSSSNVSKRQPLSLRNNKKSLGARSGLCEGEELSWCPSWSNSLWQRWSCWLVYCPGGNATEPIWIVLASSDGISSWTPLKPQHSNPKPNPLANKLWCIDFLTRPTPLIIRQGLPAFLESLKPLKNWCSIHATWPKAVWSIPYVSVVLFPSLKQNFIAYYSSKVSSRPNCIFEVLPAVTIRV